MTRKVYRASDAYCDLAQPSCTGTGEKIEYGYDTQGASLTCLSDVCPSGGCALGRLTTVNEYTVASPTVPGNSTAVCYDVRGRQRQIATTEAVSGSLPLHGETRYTYDRADHVTTMRYPDGQETVHYTYDNVGQVIGMDGTNSSGQPVVYLLNQTYDRFGRPLQVLHSNNVTDTFTYYETSENYRLQQIDTKLGNTSLQKLTYDQYHDNGLIRHVTDGVYAPASPLSNTAQFDYDGLGRLTQVSQGTTGFNGTYAEGDNLQNLTSKDGTTLTYSTTAPHRVANAAGGAAPYGAVGYDANGNRSSIAAPARTYTYTADNRLAQVTGAGVALNFAYDSTGHRTAKIVNPGASQQVTWYFGDLMEVSDRFVTKSYFAAGRRIASQRYWRPVGFLAMNEPAVQVAGLPGGHGLALVLTLRRDVQVGTGLTALLAVTLLCALPGRRRKAVVGVALRPGHVVLVLLVFAASAVPVPILVRPAGAQSPTPTPVGGDTLGIMHYHLDHLGSTQVITTQRGSVFRHIRYTAYGTVRGPWSASGASASGCATHEYCHEFTGYDTEPLTNLQYASARFYDPGVRMFLSHDPAREFASPYAYVGWDPVNGADPTGMCVWDLCLDVILIGVIAGFAPSSIQAAVNGASAGEALKQDREPGREPTGDVVLRRPDGGERPLRHQVLLRSGAAHCLTALLAAGALSRIVAHVRSDPRRVVARAHAQLAQDLRHAVLDGLLLHKELRGDRLVAFAPLDVTEDLPLACGEAHERRLSFARSPAQHDETIEEWPDELRRTPKGVVDDDPHRPGELIQRFFRQHDPVDTRRHGTQDDLLAIRQAGDQDLDVRPSPPQRAHRRGERAGLRRDDDRQPRRP